MRRDERGSAMVMVLFLILILTILGTAVLGAALGGAQRTETREHDVQALHLTEKALERAIATITADLSGKVENSQDKLNDEIETYLNNINPEIFQTDTELEGANGKITSITAKRISVGTDYPEYLITIRAEAEVNGVARKLEQEVIIDTYPDFLRYAIGTQGNLILNGAPSITGNLYAGGNLIVSDTAEYIYNGNQTRRSQFPKLNGEAHIQSLSDWKYAENGSATQSVDISGDPVQISAVIKKVLDIPMDKVKIRNRKEYVDIDVRESFVDKVTEAVGSTAERQTIANKLNAGELGQHLCERYPLTFVSLNQELLTKPIKPDEPIEPEEIEPEKWEKYYEELAVYEEQLQQYFQHVHQLTQPNQSTIFEGDLTLDGVDLTAISYGDKGNKWFIVDGDLTIDNLGDTAMPIKANMLVTGHVLIRGQAKFDATIFTLGMKGAEPESGYSTVLQDASVDSLDGKELVLISEGAILINRVDEFESATNALNAFFYTDKNAELYGVGSLFSLRGGFFAKEELTINAVVGEASKGAGGLDFNPTGNSSKPRFQVVYNQDVFDNQKTGLPRVNQINVRAGKLKME